MASRFARLKSSTPQAHREIEALIDPMKNFASLDVYNAHLLKTRPIYRPLESDLAALDWTSLGIDFASRRKTPLLEEDLRFLGTPLSQTEQCKHALARTNLDVALGCPRF